MFRHQNTFNGHIKTDLIGLFAPLLLHYGHFVIRLWRLNLDTLALKSLKCGCSVSFFIILKLSQSSIVVLEIFISCVMRYTINRGKQTTELFDVASFSLSAWLHESVYKRFWEIKELQLYVCLKTWAQFSAFNLISRNINLRF